MGLLGGKKSGLRQPNRVKKKQANYRLSDETLSALDRIASATGRNATEVVEFSVLKLASTFPDLCKDVAAACADIVSRNLGKTDPKLIDELKALGLKAEKTASDDNLADSMQKSFDKNRRAKRRSSGTTIQ